MIILITIRSKQALFKQHGIELNRKTMSEWMIKCSTLFKPIIDRLHEHLLQQSVIQADKTPLKVLKEDKSTCYMWLYCSGTDSPVQHPRKGQAYDLSNGLEHSVDVHWQTHIRSSDGLPSSAYIPPDVIGKDAMLSVALTAKTTGKKIGIHGSGCGTTPFWGGTVDVPLVNNLWMF